MQTTSRRGEEKGNGRTAQRQSSRCHTGTTHTQHRMRMRERDREDATERDTRADLQWRRQQCLHERGGERKKVTESSRRSPRSHSHPSCLPLSLCRCTAHRSCMVVRAVCVLCLRVMCAVGSVRRTIEREADGKKKERIRSSSPSRSTWQEMQAQHTITDR